MSRLLLVATIIAVSMGAEAQVVIGPSRVLHDSATDVSATDTEPMLAVTGNGNFIATWYSFFNLGGTINTDSDIFGARFTDAAGAPFTTQVVNSHAATDGSASDDRPRVGVDGLNNIVIAWESFVPVGGNGADGDLLFSRSTNGGATWSAAGNLNSLAFSDSVGDARVRLAGDNEGHWVAVWRSTNDFGGTISNDQDLFVVRSTDGGQTWSVTSVLNDTAASDGTSDDLDPVVATDGDDNWIVAWTSSYNLGGSIGTDNDILYVTSNDDGATWSTTQVLNSDAGSNFNDLEVQLAYSNGTWLCVWRSNSTMGGSGSDFDLLYATSTDNGATWSSVALLNSTATIDNATDDQPSIAGSDAGFLVAWRSVYDYLGSGTDSDIFFSVSEDGSGWSTAAIVNDFATLDSDNDQQPAVAGSNDGQWAVIWNSAYDLGGAIGTDQDILVATVTSDFAAPNAVGIVPSTSGPTNAASVSFTVTFDESVQHFDDASDVIITHGGTSSTGVNISGGPAVYTVEVTGISGDGSFTVAVSTGSGVADLVGNPLASSVTSAAVLVDNTPPGIGIGAPSALLTNSGPVSFVITYTGADSITLAPEDVALGTTGSANAAVGVSGTGSAERTVMLSGITGDGSLDISISVTGTGTDAAGNVSPVAGPSVAVVVDNTPPVFDNLLVTSGIEVPGATVQISFSTTSDLDGDPEVTVNGNPAVLLSKGTTYFTYQYVVLPSDPFGFATIQVSGFDLAGNVGLLINNNLLKIVSPEPDLPVAAWPAALALLGFGAFALRRRRS